MLLIPAASIAAEPATDMARRFGALDFVIDVSLSPDGKHVAYVVPGSGQSTVVMVSGADGSDAKPIARAGGDPLRLEGCGWSANDRVVCKEYGVALAYNQTKAAFTRTVAFDLDGGHVQSIGRRITHDETRISQFDGNVIDWLSGTDGIVLMTRDYVPEHPSNIASSWNELDGVGVDLVDTRTGRGKTVETPSRSADQYISDGRGVVRIMSSDQGGGASSELTGTTIYYYRTDKDRNWRRFSHDGPGENALRPIAVDGQANVAYALQSLDGRDALYRVALDGTMKAELVYANPTVDISGVVSIGRGGRVIGASYVTDRRQIEYFDPAYRSLATALTKVLPGLPLIYFLSASADEKQLLIFAGSDADPGHYFYFDRTDRHLNQLTLARPDLDGVTLATQHSVSYPASDGKTVPAYLTRPPGTDGKHLPVIIMPHGGPASRDEWGFDWLAQYFALRGFAVLQPEFRGSSGYGDAWYVSNGFKSWKTAIGDITDGARWLIKDGIADPDRVAILGWSYGGYAALQSAVTDPKLFKAIVAIAPVTDLNMYKDEAQNYTNARIVDRFIGAGPYVNEGSPARHADRMEAPILLFHGDQDINVNIAESQTMDRALRAAHKRSELVTFKGLDHQLDDGDARAEMLAKIDAFLREALKLPTP